MNTLADVYNEITGQLMRDYGGAQYEHLRDLVTMGLCEEAGEVAALRKRELRRNFRDVKTMMHIRDKYVEELGDVLWYLTACCVVNNIPLEEVWQANVAKLDERYGHVEGGAQHRE